ncbi:phage gp6-like head-tail connector protein [Peribacillus sp. NPDC076916]|uniref:phage gp6-like head-tail connector protein n=1 Tax=Peribacillus sp. NPDC076916 TaxID=3390608 RepID=UPI003D042478
MEDVSSDLLEEFKERMHISHSIEDDNLKRLLSFSIVDLREKCGQFDVEKDLRAKELVFERTRYSYNDALEYFNDNFLSQINSLGLSIALKESDSDAAI